MIRWLFLPRAGFTAQRPGRGGRSVVRLLTVLTVFSLILSACAVPTGAPPATAAPGQAALPQPDEKPTRTPFPTRKPPAGTRTPTLDPSAQPTGPAQGTAEPGEAGQVMLSFGGALNVRRGPGLGYDIVAAFETGNTTPAVGRDGAGEWLQVEVPNSPGVFGWVYGKANILVISGDVMSLPEATYNEAVPAYVRNCTGHQLALRPGEIILEALRQQPANRQQVNPGFYEVVDLTLGEKSVTTLSVTEGGELTVTTDGNGTNYACPR
ncbi:MAG: hypothetical protein GYA20_09425 [Chloroflexi bacterium]|nr:hypothetical protein [Chloroflexota bacterium]